MDKKEIIARLIYNLCYGKSIFVLSKNPSHKTVAKMENLYLLAKLVEQFEEEKKTLNGELASLLKKANESGVNQQNIAKQISATEAEAASITKEGIEKYKIFWKSLGNNNIPPCPFCFIVNGKHSNLETVPQRQNPEHFQCAECGKWFHVSLP